jgi:hypothetical protein
MTSADKPGPVMPFKVTIFTLDKGKDVQVQAQYNPKEVQVDKAVAWSKKDGNTAPSDQPLLEFSGGQGRTMSLELLFDGYEEDKDVHAEYVSKLLDMASIIKADGTAEQKRPPLIGVVWGGGKDDTSKLPAFKGVIESLSTKYTMFAADGKPVRATCTVKLKEADKLSLKAAGRGRSA